MHTNPFSITVSILVGDENLALHFNMATLALMILQNRVRPSHDKSEKGMSIDYRINATVQYIFPSIIISKNSLLCLMYIGYCL